MPGGSNTPVRGLGFAFLSFALFATHDAIIKALGQTYSVFQILFFAMLFAFYTFARAVNRGTLASAVLAAVAYLYMVSMFSTHCYQIRPVGILAPYFPS